MVEGGAASLDVELRHVSKHYGSVRALDDLSLEVRAGEFFTLLGPSGCGKTTALRSIAGFVAPDAGEVWIKGSRVTGVPAHRRRVGMVFQHYALFPHRTVAQNVAFGLRMQGVPRDDIARRVESALELVRLPGHADRFPRQLSGGEQQRVALARAVVTRPTVLLLDEPLGALDKKLREEMQVELKRLQREVGITAIYVTHDQEEALTMSDRIAVMRGGRLEQIGRPLEIYERPSTAFVADFIGTTNLLRGRVVAHDGGVATVECSNLTLRVAVARTECEEVVVALRPETVALDGPPGQDNTVSARILQLVYMGNTRVYSLATDGGVAFKATELAGTGAAVRAVGDRVTASWPAEAATLLRA